MSNPIKKTLKNILTSFADYFGQHQRTSKSPKLWILMYHRVLPKNDPRFALEEPGMIVTPDTLKMHLREIKRHFEVIKLSEWIARKNAGEPLPTKACVVTFDDGWADNYEYAFPILKEEQIPATLFAVADKIDSDFQFWPNIVLGYLLQGKLDALINHNLFATIAAQLGNPAQVDREYAAQFIAHLKKSSDSDIFAALDSLDWHAQLSDTLPKALMNWQQLQEMQDSGLVEIGSHTCTHKRLHQALTNEQLDHEIISSKRKIEKQLQSAVELFCFPNGDYGANALQRVESHYSAAVTTKKGIVNLDCPHHELTRIGIHEEVSYSPRLFGARLSGWL